jgi:hypothetical protein
MGDNDFPTVMANGAFLQGFMKKKGMISEQVTGQPPRALSYESQQVLGGPEIAQVQSTDIPAMGPEIPQGMVGPVTESMFPGYLQRKDELLRRLGRLKKV